MVCQLFSIFCCQYLVEIIGSDTSPYAEGIFKLHITVPDRSYSTINTITNIYDNAYGPTGTFTPLNVNIIG